MHLSQHPLHNKTNATICNVSNKSLLTRYKLLTMLWNTHDLSDRIHKIKKRVSQTAPFSPCIPGQPKKDVFQFFVLNKISAPAIDPNYFLSVDNSKSALPNYLFLCFHHFHSFGWPLKVFRWLTVRIGHTHQEEEKERKRETNKKERGRVLYRPPLLGRKFFFCDLHLDKRGPNLLLKRLVG
jgi:hypothetical protein